MPVFKQSENSGIFAAIYKLLQIVNKEWHNHVNLHLKSYKLDLCKMPKNLINQMVKCAKKLINLLTKLANVLKGCLHQGGKSFGVVCVCVLHQFSVSPHMYTPIFARQITKRLQNIFSVVTKQRQS